MTALVRLYKKALQQIARVLAGTADERDAEAVLLEIKGQKEVYRATWKKLVLDMKVPYELATTCSQALQPTQQQPAAGVAAAAALHVFLMKLFEHRDETVPDIVAEAALQQLQATQLLQQLPGMLTGTAQLLGAESRELRSRVAVADSSSSSSSRSSAAHQRQQHGSGAAAAATDVKLAHGRVYVAHTRAEALLGLFYVAYQLCHIERDHIGMGDVMDSAPGVLHLCVAGLRSVCCQLGVLGKPTANTYGAYEQAQHLLCIALACLNSLLDERDEGGPSGFAARWWRGNVASSPFFSACASAFAVLGCFTLRASTQQQPASAHASDVPDCPFLHTGQIDMWGCVHNAWSIAARMQESLTPCQHRLCRMLGLDYRALLWAAAHMATWGKDMVTPHLMKCLLSAHTTALQQRVKLAERQPQAAPAGQQQQQAAPAERQPQAAAPARQQQQEQLLRLLPVDATIQVHLAPLVIDTAAELLLSDLTHADAAAAELALLDATDTDSHSDSDSDGGPTPDTGSDPVWFSQAAAEASETALDCWGLHQCAAGIPPAHSSQQDGQPQEGEPQPLQVSQQLQQQRVLSDGIVAELLPSLLKLASKLRSQADASSAAAACSDGDSPHWLPTRALDASVRVLCGVLMSCITQRTNSDDSTGEVPPAAAPAAALTAGSGVGCGPGAVWQVPTQLVQQAQQVLAVLEGYARLTAAEIARESKVSQIMTALMHPLMCEATGGTAFRSVRNSSKLTDCLYVLAEAGSMPQRQYCSLLASLAKVSTAWAAAWSGQPVISAKVSMAVALFAASHLCWGFEDRLEAAAAAAASGSVAVSNSSSSSSGTGPAAAVAGSSAAAGYAAVALSKLPALFMIGRSCLQHAELLQAGGTPAALDSYVFRLSKWIAKAVEKAAQWLQYRENADVLQAAGYAPQQLLQALQDMQAAAEAVEGPRGSVTAAACTAYVQKLRAAALALTSLPTSVCCNNPGCTVMSGLAELHLVSGRGCLCAGCLTARYCCKLPCQKQHWRQHKPVCKALAAAATAAAKVT